MTEFPTPARPADPARCPNCGDVIGPDDRFCTRCGAAIPEPPTAAPSPPPPGPRRPLERPEPVRAVESSADTVWREVQEQLVAATAGRYEIIRELGRGGMAAVYLGNEVRLKRQVAIKVMAPNLLLDPGMVERFAREARTMASLYHPNIVTVFAVEEVRLLHFFVMQFIPGRSLDRVIRSGEAVPIPAVQAILYQAAAGISHAHRQGVIHRDIKPANIMLDLQGNAVVTDFGIAKVSEHGSATLTVGPIGTPLYMSPEQCAGGAITPATDQYALGNVAYELLTGRPPFQGDSALSLGAAILQQKPKPIRTIRPDCPPDIDAAVLKMLSKSPQDRFGTVSEAIAALRGKALDEEDPTRKVLIALAHPDLPRPSGRVDVRITPVPAAGAISAPAPAPVPVPVPRRQPVSAAVGRAVAAGRSFARTLATAIRRIGRKWVIGGVAIVSLVVVGFVIRELLRPSIEQRRTGLLRRVDSLVLGLTPRRVAPAGMVGALAAARNDLAALRATVASGNPSRAALDSVARDVADPGGRYQTLLRAALFDPATVPPTARSAVVVVAAQFASGSLRSGTGFVVRTRGDTVWIATTLHLVQDSSGVHADETGVIFHGDGLAVRAAIAEESVPDDLALLVATIPGGGRVVSGVADSAARGEPVAMIGFPTGFDAVGKGPSTGITATTSVGSVTRMEADHLEVDAYGARGSSGSPVFNAAGVVVGMVFGARGDGDQRRFYALPGRVLTRLIDRIGRAP